LPYWAEMVLIDSSINAISSTVLMVFMFGVLKSKNNKIRI
jgi:hypothetical protein